MKKHRGLKRYYRNLQFQNEFDKIFWLDLNNPQTWSENWHLHFDWWGYGNNSFKRRKPHLDKLFRHFSFLANKIKLPQSDFQLYAVILDFSSYHDALFLHTPNPDNSQFPFKIESLSKVSTLKNKALNAYINNLDQYQKLYGQANEAFCLLYRQNVGQTF